MRLRRPDGDILMVEIEKDESEDIGLSFEKPLLDEEKAVVTIVYSALLTSFRKVCANHYTIRMMTPDCHFSWKLYHYDKYE